MIKKLLFINFEHEQLKKMSHLSFDTITKNDQVEYANCDTRDAFREFVGKFMDEIEDSRFNIIPQSMREKLKGEYDTGLDKVDSCWDDED
jgi:hypothetical protein